MKTPLTKEWLKRAGFHNLNNSENYRLNIKLPYSGTRFFEAGELPHNRWICYYLVNDIPACMVMDTEEEVKQLYFSVQKEELVIK